MEKINKAKAIELLRMSLDKIPALREAEHDLPNLDKELKKWKINTEMKIAVYLAKNLHILENSGKFHSHLQCS